MGWPEPEDFRDAEPFIRRRWDAGFDRHRQSWLEVRDAYRFGWEWGRSRTMTGTAWPDAEPQLRRHWKNSPIGRTKEWDDVRAIVWDAFTGGRRDTWWHDFSRKTW